MSEETAAPASGPGTLTDDIWWAHQNPAVQKLRTMPAGPKRNSEITLLQAKGFLLDGAVIGMGWGPSWQQSYLKAAGEVWYPAMGYAQLLGGPAEYPEGPMPTWGIKVSDDAADYPAWGTK